MPSGGNATAVLDGVAFVFLLKFGAAVFLLIVGFGGMWVTRSLYGDAQVHNAQFSRFK